MAILTQYQGQVLRQRVKNLNHYLEAWLLASGQSYTLPSIDEGLILPNTLPINEYTPDAANVLFGAAVDMWTGDTATEIGNLEAAIGNNVAAMHMFSYPFDNDFDKSTAFQSGGGYYGLVMDAYNLGKLPILNFTFKNNNSSSEWVTFDEVLAGALDGHFDSMIAGFGPNDFGYPIMITLNHEMNGDWASYSQDNPSTNATTQGYIDSWRYMFDYIRPSAPNILFGFVISGGSVNTSTNSSSLTPYTDYYPGDTYVDWVGMDFYNNRDLTHVQESFAMLESHNKPIIIKEFGIGEARALDHPGVYPGHDAWLTSMMEEFTKHPLLKVALYFDRNEHKLDGRDEERVKAAVAIKNALDTSRFQNYPIDSAFKNEIGRFWSTWSQNTDYFYHSDSNKDYRCSATGSRKLLVYDGLITKSSEISFDYYPDEADWKYGGAAFRFDGTDNAYIVRLGTVTLPWRIEQVSVNRLSDWSTILNDGSVSREMTPGDRITIRCMQSGQGIIFKVWHQETLLTEFTENGIDYPAGKTCCFANVWHEVAFKNIRVNNVLGD